MPVKGPKAELLGREDDFHGSDVESIHVCFLIKTPSPIIVIRINTFLNGFSFFIKESIFNLQVREIISFFRKNHFGNLGIPGADCEYPGLYFFGGLFLRSQRVHEWYTTLLIMVHYCECLRTFDANCLILCTTTLTGWCV